MSNRSTQIGLRLIFFIAGQSVRSLRSIPASENHLKSENFFERLGLTNPDASIEQIKHAFHEASRKYHPDKQEVDGGLGLSPEDANAAMYLVFEAYQCLRDDDKREFHKRKVKRNTSRTSQTSSSSQPRARSKPTSSSSSHPTRTSATEFHDFQKFFSENRTDFPGPFDFGSGSGDFPGPFDFGSGRPFDFPERTSSESNYPGGYSRGANAAPPSNRQRETNFQNDPVISGKRVVVQVKNSEDRKTIANGILAIAGPRDGTSDKYVVTLAREVTMKGLNGGPPQTSNQILLHKDDLIILA